MHQPGELALHPHKFARILECLFLAILDVATDQITALFGAALVPGLFGCVIVELPDFFTVLNRSVECEIWITVLRSPNNRFPARDSRNPNARVRLLQWQDPWVDDAELVMPAFPSPRS